MRFLLISLLLLASRVAFAQAIRPWPRNAVTGSIEFVGQLLWPGSVRTEAQRQLLVRRWYRRTLTNDTPAMIRRLIQKSGTTYGGIPTYNCYRLAIAGPDEERFNLCFELALSSSDTGLTYQLVNFECSESVFDAITGTLLEDALELPDARVQAVITIFHERLLTVAKGW